MSATFVLPKKDYEQVIVVNTPLAADAVLASGIVTLKDEDGIDALALRRYDILAGKKYAWSAGAASVAAIVLTSVSIVNNSRYELIVSLPNRKDFLLYGKEYNPLLALRSFQVSVDATATVDELGALFAAAINADIEAGFTASYNSSNDTLTITAASVEAGKFSITAPAGASTTITYTEPVGTISEVEANAPGKYLAGTDYNRYEFKVKKLLKHNAVSGLSVYKTVKYAVYAKKSSTAYEAVLDNLLAGTIAVTDLATVGTEVAKYFAVPSL